MRIVKLGRKEYQVDDGGFLVDYQHWDEDFAKETASEVKIEGELTREHWDVINFIRKTFEETGKCPLVYETCRQNGLRLKGLRDLFPTGYLRGACKLSGITYREGYLGQSLLPATADDLNTIAANKTYEVDVRGFLAHHDEWDEYFAAHRAHEMKIPGGKLTEAHWKIIRYLRETFETTGGVPTIYETCEANGIELEQLEQLFPDGYHRGAVKIAGLCVR